jgi:hypothetical protein
LQRQSATGDLYAAKDRMFAANNPLGDSEFDSA